MGLSEEGQAWPQPEANSSAPVQPNRVTFPRYDGLADARIADEPKTQAPGPELELAAL